jgi:hypothetical protein
MVWTVSRVEQVRVCDTAGGFRLFKKNGLFTTLASEKVARGVVLLRQGNGGTTSLFFGAQDTCRAP